MNDFDYDAMQKKRLANSARKRVNGSKSRRCSLPSDNLTPAQREKLNGECKSWSLNDPMDYETFKSMPLDLQVQYVNGLKSRFSIGVGTIAEELFGISRTALIKYFKIHDIKADVTGKRLNAGERKVWEEWLGREPAEEPEEADEALLTEEEHREPECPTRTDTAQDFGMGAITVEWCGEFNAAVFMQQLAKMPFPTGRVKIRLEVTKE